MPIEVRRFGVGFRRPEGPPGTHGLTGQVIHSDGRGLISELAFTRGGAIAPHENPNTTWFCVIEGGGWVQVGDERRRVAAGEAVLWPANETHAAWTEQGEMRAIVVEFPDSDTREMRTIVGRVGDVVGEVTARGEGALSPGIPPVRHRDETSGEPL